MPGEFSELYHKFPKEVSEKVESEYRLKPIVNLDYLEALCEGNETLKELLKEMLNYCYRYTETTIRFHQALQELDNPEKAKERAELDLETKTVHDATIDSINIFSRALARNGKDNSWMEKVGQHRSAYAKFVFTLVFDELAKEIETYQEKEVAN